MFSGHWFYLDYAWLVALYWSSHSSWTYSSCLHCISASWPVVQENEVLRSPFWIAGKEVSEKY